MSEMFAYYEEENIGIHFVIEKEDTGVWHTYLIAINEDDYDEFMEEHEEFQTKEWKVQKALKMLNEMGLTVEDLK